MKIFARERFRKASDGMPQYCSGGAEDQDFGQRRRMHSSAALRPTVSMTGPLASAHGERDEVPLPVANCNRKVGLRDRQTDPVS